MDPPAAGFENHLIFALIQNDHRHVLCDPVWRRIGLCG